MKYQWVEEVQDAYMINYEQYGDDQRAYDYAVNEAYGMVMRDAGILHVVDLSLEIVATIHELITAALGDWARCSVEDDEDLDVDYDADVDWEVDLFPELDLEF